MHSKADLYAFAPQVSCCILYSMYIEAQVACHAIEGLGVANQNSFRKQVADYVQHFPAFEAASAEYLSCTFIERLRTAVRVTSVVIVRL